MQHIPPCPVCCGGNTGAFLCVGSRRYLRCADCAARFLDPARYLNREEELAHYLHHENDPDDPRYRQFLSRLAGPLMERLAPGTVGLDYGCGPGPALAAMLSEAGFDMALYDPYFHPDTDVLRRTYDFITCTETAEHFYDPAAEFARLMAMVRPGGWLAFMTCFQTDDARFEAWHYRKDPTHVVFYRPATFQFIAAAAGWSCDIPVKDVALMQRPLAQGHA